MKKKEKNVLDEPSFPREIELKKTNLKIKNHRKTITVTHSSIRPLSSPKIYFRYKAVICIGAENGAYFPAFCSSPRLYPIPGKWSSV